MIKKGFGAYKVPNGKFLKVNIDFDENNIIKKIIITGDFFIFPEITINRIEEILLNQRLPLDSNDIKSKIDTLIKDSDANLVGLSINDIINTVNLAWKNIE